MKLVLFFFILCYSSLGLAAEISGHPGWDISEYVSEDGENYYSLQPSDGRTSISVNASTAEKIQSGELDPSIIYRTSSASSTSSEDNVYSAAGLNAAGMKPAEDISSTAPQSENSSITYSSTQAATEVKNNNADEPVSKSSSDSSLIPVVHDQYPKENSFASSSPSLDSNGNLKNQIHGVQRGIANAVEEANKNISSNIGAKTSSETENSHKEKSLEKPAKEEKTNIPAIIMSNVNENKEKAIELKEEFKPCTGGRKEITEPTNMKISVEKSCRFISITAWGAGGGNGRDTQVGMVGGIGVGDYGPVTVPIKGGGGSYVFGSGEFDGSQFDLFIVVGAAGRNSTSTTNKSANYGAGSGGVSESSSGAGGGGYTGVFLVKKGNMVSSSPSQTNALVVAAGGGGAGGRGGIGGAGGLEKGGGGALGASHSGGGVATGNASSGAALRGGDGGDGIEVASSQCNDTNSGGVNHCNSNNSNSFGSGMDSNQNTFQAVAATSAGGGGGGGGYFGGAGGAGVGANGRTQGGGGGSSFLGLSNGLWKAAEGSIGGNKYLQPMKGSAGDAGHHGKLIIEWR